VGSETDRVRITINEEVWNREEKVMRQAGFGKQELLFLISLKDLVE
jgi:hypothetical protein